ncbi:type VII secretion target [Phaeacidiphilus oryzae]|uniref:type VII secretion target n=1 Tax=Phaeacidiphilus oryzae TaxID=348818 RepID=UPI00056604EA|nr:type VII secretion target [Phaeacidiphilus oryzae]
MSGDSFTVHPQAVQDYAKVVQAQADAMRRIHGSLAAVNVSADWFGHLPESSSLHSQYESHAQAEKTNTSQMADFLEAIGESLADIARTYQEVDQHHATELKSLHVREA